MKSEFFAQHGEGWDHDTGRVGINTFATALQVWAIRNREAGKPSTVAVAAEAFCCDPRMIIEAVDWFYWMFLAGPTDDYSKLQIEHEGE